MPPMPILLAYSASRIPGVQYLVTPQHCDARHDDNPYGERAGADNGGIFQPYDIPQPQDRCSGIDFKHQLRLVGNRFAPATHAGSEVLVPPPEGSYDKVVQAADESGKEQRFRLASSLFARNQHLRAGGGFGKRIFAVLLAYEILAERNEKQDTKDTSQQRADEHLEKVDRHFRILVLKDVKCRKGEDGSGYDNARTCPDGLDDDVFAQCAFTLGGSRHSHGNDGDGDGGFEYLSHFQPQVCCCCREEYCHGNAPRHRPGIYFGIILVGRHQGVVLFARFQWTERVFGQSRRFFICFFHVVLLFLVSIYLFVPDEALCIVPSVM